MKRAAAIPFIIGVIFLPAGAFDQMAVERRMNDLHRHWISNQEFWVFETLKTCGWVGIIAGAVVQSLPRRLAKRSQGFEVISKKK